MSDKETLAGYEAGRIDEQQRIKEWAEAKRKHACRELRRSMYKPEIAELSGWVGAMNMLLKELEGKDE